MTMPERDFEFDVFLSHASEDTAWCEQLAVRLRSAGVRVWFDRWQLKPGHNLDDRINHGLEHSRKLVAVWTEHYFADRKVWTLAESHAALNEEVLIPLLRRDCKIKPTLRGILYLDFRKDDEFELRFRELLEALGLPNRETPREVTPDLPPPTPVLDKPARPSPEPPPARETGPATSTPSQPAAIRSDLSLQPAAEPLEETKVRPVKAHSATYRPWLEMVARFPRSKLALPIGLALVAVCVGVWQWVAWSNSPRRTDAAAWKAAERVATKDAPSDYTNKEPSGSHVAEATARIGVSQQNNSDETAWAMAKQATNITGVKAYLSAFTNGRHLSEASALLEKLKSAAEPSTTPQLGKPWTNSFGMAFAPVAGTKVLFGVWDVRVKDFAAFAADSAGFGGLDYQKGSEPFVLKSDGWKQQGWEYGWNNPGFAQTPEDPVVCVSWDDAQAFCTWLTKLERVKEKLNAGQSYRLPADWEWSVAVGLNEPQAGTPKEKDEQTPGVYPWGKTWPPTNGAGNYAGTEAKDADWPSISTIEGYQDKFARTSPVGSFPANPHGLYDLGGNVWQWCEDWFDSEKKYRGLRGGSWIRNDPRYLLSSCRRYYPPDYRGDDIGFRCVLVVGGSVR
jgi:formylglycine-generating enzyme required for sulfatase activity